MNSPLYTATKANFTDLNIASRIGWNLIIHLHIGLWGCYITCSFKSVQRKTSETHANCCRRLGCITKGMMRDGPGFKELHIKEATVRWVKQHTQPHMYTVFKVRGARDDSFLIFSTITHLQPFIPTSEAETVRWCNCAVA